MVELFKILIETPEKLRKVGIFLIKQTLNVIFAAKLYTLWIGKFDIINIKDFAAWSEYFLSGRVLICVLMYFVSEIFLFQILSGITDGLMRLFYWLAVKKFTFGRTRDEKDYVLKVLSWFHLVSINEKTKKVEAGKNTNEFYEFVEAFNQKDSKQEITSIKNSLVQDLVHTFFVFVFLYYSFINIKPCNKSINTIIGAGCIILPLLYTGASVLLDFLHKNSKDLLFGIQGLKFEKLIYDTLREIGVYPIDIDEPSKKGYEKVIYHNNKEYILKFAYGKRPLFEFQIEYYRDLFLKEEKGMVLISSRDLTKNAQDLADEFKRSLLVITFKTEDDLVMKLEEFFKEK